jgi:hypothetical protein
MKTLIVALYFFIHLSAMSASLFEKKLEVFSCNSKQESYDCKTCTKEMNITVVHKVNVTTQVVLQQVYEKDRFTNSSSFESCKVANEKNWECIERATLSNGGNLLTAYRMNNGIYSYSHEGISYGDNRLNIPTREYKNYACAK